MPTVKPSQVSVAVKSSYQAFAVAGFPDVCRTPSPGGPVPIPYPNAGYVQQNTAGSKAPSIVSKPVLTKDSNYMRSSGDEAGSAMGVMTNKTQGPYFKLQGQQLRGQLQMLHMQIANLPSGDPARWHKLLDQYVVYTAELYRHLSD